MREGRGRGYSLRVCIPPVFPGKAVVHGVGPGSRDVLTEVGCVFDFEVWDVLLDGGLELEGGEGEGGDVVDASLHVCLGGFEEVDCGLEAVGHVHHGERLVLVQVAHKLACLECVVEHKHRVVGRATPRESVSRDHSRVPQAPEVHPVLRFVVLPDLLKENLRHSVHSGWKQDRVVLCHILARLRGEHRNSGGREDTAAEVFADVENVSHAGDVDVHRALWVELSHTGDDRGVVHDPIDVVVDDGLGKGVVVHHVAVDEGAVLAVLGELDVAGHHVLHTVLFTQNSDQLGSNLPHAPCDQDPV